MIEEDENAPTVVDLVDAFVLNEVTMGKADIMAWAKPYLAKVVEKLTASGKADRVPIFKAEAANIIKFVMSKIDEFQFYYGKGYDPDGALVFSYTADQSDAGPTFLMFADGLKAEKFWEAEFEALKKYKKAPYCFLHSQKGSRIAK